MAKKKRSRSKPRKKTLAQAAKKQPKIRRFEPKEGPAEISDEQLRQERRAIAEGGNGREFPIVGVGASAGGLEAFSQFLSRLPGDTGMAFVFVQHLDPKHESMLSELLSRSTKIPVTEVRDGMAVRPDHIYVIPRNSNMSIQGGVLKLMPRPESRAQHMPIDYFLRSLAKDVGSRAIGVILSGTASDGALGLEAIKAEGGITFAQDDKTARYDGMPRAAISTGCVDFILPPERIADELTSIGRHPYITDATAEKTDELLPEVQDHMDKIFDLLAATSGVDFRNYKHSTIRRRISRRMALQKMNNPSAYLNYLHENREEATALYQDILIKVTSFFRDPETFEVLKERVFPKIAKPGSQVPIRIWVPGCATGEEAYSIAICLLEYLGGNATNTPIQIFATDISDSSLEKARVGIYLENIALDVSAERLSRFFNWVDNGYQISKSIRDMCIFAKQNVTIDPPFSKLDLISCRNLLIYLGPVLQKRVVPIFHYALKPTGFLVLGSSETISPFLDLFNVVDKKYRIHSKKVASSRLAFDFALGASGKAAETEEAVTHTRGEARSILDVQKEADGIMLARYTPAGVIVNDDMEIIHFRGHTSPYLEPATGRASLNLLKMAREGLLMELRSLVHKARNSKVPVQGRNIEFSYNDHTRHVNIEVIPLKSFAPTERYFLVLFADVTPEQLPEVKRPKLQKVKVTSRQRAAERRIAELQNEISATKDYLQSSIEEQEATNEELKSANEEILSSNEELQSTNEELETAKEELQSTNEELTTVNEELENRNAELTQSNNDLNNLLANVNIPIVMLGSDLRIRRFTPMAEKVLNLIPTDIGRPLTDLKTSTKVPNLDHIILEVIDSVATKELEVQDHNGRLYSLRVQPYRTQDNKIDGAVMILVDIDEIRHHLEAVKQAHEYEALLKEIHHRIKNNLQIISSLLNLQTEFIKDERSLEVFRESQNRIKSMAVIHELLYESGDLAKINFGEYIRKLAIQIFRSYGIDPQLIPLKIDIKNVAISIDTAIVCGAIINELVSNALKHAFPDHKNGEIVIALEPARDGDYILIVRDDGIGFPQNIDFRNTKTLGYQLITTLVNQLEGQIELDGSNGTKINIKFKDFKPTERNLSYGSREDSARRG